MNGVRTSIDFSIENMMNDRIRFLDIIIIKCAGSLQFEPFMKPYHPRHILPWSSHHPQQVILPKAVDEFLRSERLSANFRLRKKSFF